MLQEKELESVMRACMEESGMELPESDIQDMATALMEEAVEDEGGEVPDEIDIDQLKQVLMKHQGLLENLNLR